MRYISLFSGIEAASVAWEPLGWEPLAFCEIDEFPSAVLAHRFPDVENLGDITKVDWKEVIARHGRPDIVVGGSPCQSFSVAGGRESLSGESRLMFEYVRALDEIRPRWFLWENVPGVLNTRDNAFAQLLGEVQKLGYGSLAWRVLDAQFFGVAQRRRRVFLVGRLGEGGSAAAVLFEPESLRGDNPSSREKRKALARAAGRGPACEGEGSLNAWDVQSKRVFSENGVAPTLSSGTSEGANIQPSVLQHADTIAFKYSAGAAARTMPTYNDGTCNTLTADYHAPAVAFAQEGHMPESGLGNQPEQSPTLTADYHNPAVMQLTGFSRECEAYRTIPLECPVCGSNAEVSVDDPQEPEILWRYSCGCSSLGCEKYGRLRRSWPTREESIADWNKDVLLSFSIDYKQTPKVNEEICHTLTHEGNGGIHSAVAFAQNTRNEVRLQGGGTVVGALGASRSAKGQGVPFVMATGQANAEVTEDMTPTLNCAHEQPIAVSGASTQYGDEVAGTLTARADSSPCADRGQNVVCMADDNAKAAIDKDVCGTLKVGGAPPLVVSVTDKT